MMTSAVRTAMAACAAICLCATMAGCAADVAAPATQGDVAHHHLRYYGGPKSPMWPAQ